MASRWLWWPKGHLNHFTFLGDDVQRFCSFEKHDEGPCPRCGAVV